MNRNFKIKKGDEFSFSVAFKNLTKEPNEILFGVKSEYNNKDYDLLLKVGEGIQRLDSYKYVVRISPEECNKLKINNYVYDLRFKIDDTIKTPLSGKLIISDVVFK